MTRLRSIVLSLCLPPLAIGCGVARDPPDAIYGCANNLGFEVRYADTLADVTTATRNYALSQVESSIGRRYTSAIAALVIDGDAASLVIDGEPRYLKCRLA